MTSDPLLPGPGRREPVSLLSEQVPGQPAVTPDPPDEALFSDLNLDQVVAAAARGRDERELITRLLGQRLRDPATIMYRHEVFRDLEDPGLFQAASQFTEQMRRVRSHLGQLDRMHSPYQRQGWFLDAAAIYCDAVRAVAARLEEPAARSRGLTALRDYLRAYLRSPEFTGLAADTERRKSDLGGITYQVRIKGSRVEVGRYGGEPDYSAEIEQAFERFRQDAAEDYRVRYRTWPGMNHVGEQILSLVARLFSDEFSELARYGDRHARFMDPVIDRVGREFHFYLAYLAYIAPQRAAGLSFCYPDLAAGSKDIFARGTFDIALAARLTAAGKPVVTNEFCLTGPERVIVVSGPNQGGKTTFARAFGQLHHLACTGCPVPGTAARLFVPDQVFTHFEHEEDLADLAGKLEDDLLRIQKALLAATPDSVVIMNEIFTSTTASDARYLGEKVLAKVLDLGLLCIYVTFIGELASLSPAVVSMTSTIGASDPAERTFKVTRRPADGLAYAMAIARKHRVTYEQLRERMAS